MRTQVISSPAKRFPASRFALVAWLALGWPASSAHAQGIAAQPEYLPDTPDDNQRDRDQRARLAFEQGKAAYEAGEYREAWKQFHDSYQLSQRPELLYNIGQTADRLRMDADALKAFRLYLQHLPNAENRREVENRIRALEERSAQNGDAPAPPAENGSEGQAAPVAAPAKADAPAPPVGGQPMRKNWYLRGALGLGFRRDGISGGGTDATISGAGLSGELALGTTLLPGLALGGGLFFDGTTKATLSSDAGGDSSRDGTLLWMLGPMVDWYLEPETEGWHLQGAVTLAVVNFQKDAVSTSTVAAGIKDAAGLGLLLGGGYEWPLSNELAFGVSGRFVFAGVSEASFTHGIFSPSVLATITWW